MSRLLALFIGFTASAAPVLQFSTYLGGHNREVAAKTATAPDGSVYAAVSTLSNDLPVTAGAAQTGLAAGTCNNLDQEGGVRPGPCYDVYVAQLSASGAILHATYLGGSANDSVAAIQIDRVGNVWVAGATQSTDFPRAKVIGSFDGSAPATFVAELSPDLGTVTRSTILAGATAPAALALDSAGAAYVAGSTGSAALPATAGVIQPARSVGNAFSDGFLAKLAADGTLAFATYFGGNNQTIIVGLTVDTAGGVTLGGYTQAADLPAGGTRYGTRSGSSDVFMAKLSPDAKSVQWLRYIGGSGFDSLGALASDAAGNLYGGGIVNSPDFAGDDFSGETPSMPRGFVTKVSADGATLLSSRLFGYEVDALAVDTTGSIWLTGICCFGALQASDTALQIARNGFPTDAYLVELSDSGPPVWASYIGGSDTDRGTSVSATADGVVMAGITQSYDLPLDHAVQTSLHSTPGVSPVLEDAFVMRFGAAAVGPPSFTAGAVTNAASYRAGEAAPGSIVSIFGDDLSTVVRAAGTAPLPSTLGGLSVTVNGVAAPLFYVSPSQVNAQIPFETAVGTATIQVSRGGAVSTAQQLSIVPISPGLFTSISGFAAINSQSSPPRVGEWITLYATGLGAVDGPVTTGQSATGNPPPQVAAQVTVTLGGTSLAVLWAGLAPGYVGLYQINAMLPADIGVAAGTFPLVASAGGKSSNPGSVSVLRQ
jgi:uncharacterized protein (TIGR03437 family)